MLHSTKNLKSHLELVCTRWSSLPAFLNSSEIVIKEPYALLDCTKAKSFWGSLVQITLNYSGWPNPKQTMKKPNEIVLNLTDKMAVQI